METAPESETPFEQRCKRERLRASIAFRIGIAVLILSLLLPCLAAPFLVPYFQLFLLIPFVLGMFYGLLGGWFHNWWVTVGLTTASLAMFVSCDLATDSYGYAALPTYIATGSLPIGAMYYDSWGLLYKVTVIPVGYGLACAVHAAIILRRQRRKRDAESRGCCANCAYSLRGLTEARCPECGEPFDALSVRLALSRDDNEPESRAGTNGH